MSLHSVSVGGIIYGCSLSLTSVHTTAVCVERGLQGLRTLPQTLFMVPLPGPCTEWFQKLNYDNELI